MGAPGESRYGWRSVHATWHRARPIAANPARRPEAPPSLHLSGLTAAVQSLLDEAQAALRARAHAFREERTEAVDDRAALTAALTQGYAFARWCEDVTCAQDMQQNTRATVRCFPVERTNGKFARLPDDPGPCAWCGQPAYRRAIVARAY